MNKVQMFSLSVKSIWAFLFLFALTLSADDKVNSSPSQESINSKYILCRFSKAVRTVRVIEDSYGCKVSYAKQGQDKIVGSSKSLDVCLGILKSIRTNLEQGNWTCKDISGSSVTESNEGSKPSL